MHVVSTLILATVPLNMKGCFLTFTVGGTHNLILQFWRTNTTYLPFSEQESGFSMASST